MKKILLALLLSPTLAFAATYYTGSMSLITPEVATAHRVFHYSATDSAGNLLVCPYYEWYSYKKGTCTDDAGNNKWAHVKSMVPAGKTYAGYSINSNSGAVYIYWR